MTEDFIRQLEQIEDLDLDVIDKKDAELDGFNISEREDIFGRMDQIFSANQSFDKKYKFSYFRWYTDFAWKIFNNRDRDFVVQVAMARQVPMAILLDFEVWRTIMGYLAMRTVDQQDMQELYFKMKEAFLNSQAVVGLWQGKEVLVKDLVDEIKKLNAKPRDSMEQAEFESRMQQIFFNKEDKKFANYIFSDPATVIDRFVGLVQFFLGVTEKDIWNMVDAFLHPEKFETPVQVDDEDNSEYIETREEPEELSSIATANQEDVGEKQVQVGEQPNVIAEFVKVPSYLEIKSQIESEFKKDAEGNFEDIDAVMRKLEEFTEMYNDPKIADLIYFDEEEGRFKWKI